VAEAFAGDGDQGECQSRAMNRPHAIPTSPALSLAWTGLRRFAAGLRLCRERRRQRLALARLGDHLLKDIGLTAADVDAECAKPFWR
jgi:uncharacterized protein YjiS (DUF1127 family)